MQTNLKEVPEEYARMTSWSLILSRFLKLMQLFVISKRKNFSDFVTFIGMVGADVYSHIQVALYDV